MNARILLVCLILGATPLMTTLAQGAGDSAGVCTQTICVSPQLPCAVEAASAPTGCLPVDPLPPRLPGATACGRGAASFSFRLDTGASAAGTPLATGSPDPVWKVGPAAPNGPAYAKGAAIDPAAWVQVSDAAWINPYPASVVSGPLSDFQYGAAFVIPANAYGVVVSGDYAADNSAVVTLAPGGFATYASPANAFSATSPVSWSGLTPGSYVLGAAVHNRASSLGADTPTGFLAEITVKGLCSHNVFVGSCANGATSFTIVINTGIGPYGNPLPAGSVDPRWTSPAPTPSPAFTHAPHSGWVSDPSSSWLNTNPVSTASLGGVDLGSATYQLHYVVPANAYNVVLSGRFAADNSGTFADTDARASWLLATTPSPEGFASWTSFYHPIAINGPHIIDVQVTDQGVASGVNVVGTVTGQCGKLVDTGPVKDILNSLL